MRSRLSKWVIPGILTVLIGTAATMQFAKPTLESDLSARAQEALKTANIHWADVRFNGRDAELTGMSESASQAESAAVLVGQLRGVRVVSRAVEQAPIASPYLFVATIDAGAIGLSGGAPDEAARRSLLEKAGLESAGLDILSGVKDRAKWLAATDFALRQLQHFDEGEVQLTDMTLSLSGRAKSRASFETMSIVLDAGLPDGVETGDVSIVPPVESPFIWQAEYDGTQIVTSGFAPDEQAIKAIENSTPSDTSIASDIVLGSGAPKNFATNATALISAFAQVETGSAQISDQKISFTGTPRGEAEAKSLTNLLGTLNADFDLTPRADTAIETEAADAKTAEAIAQTTIATPPLPLLDSLATPPQVTANEQQAEQSEQETPAAAIDQAVVITPDLPNLEALANAPEMPVEIVPEANERMEEEAAAAATEEAIVADATDEATTPDSPAPITTPPLPNLLALSTPPTVPSIQDDENNTEKDDAGDEVTPPVVASLPKSVPPTMPINQERITLCRNLVAGFETENAILFAPASAKLTEESETPLNRLAVFLKQCPRVEIHVEGHTDSDGPEPANLALSVARAETVVVELIERGIDASRLYAVGYGESVPLVPNTTRDGKRQNRRIEFEIIETAE